MIIPMSQRAAAIEEYYFARKLRELGSCAPEGLPVINLGIGNPDLPPSPQTITALCEAARRPDVHGYQPYRGTDRLRRAIADWYSRELHVTLDPQTEVLPLMGSKMGVFLLSLTFLNPGDAVLVPDPGYPGYAGAARLAGAQAIPYDLHERHNWVAQVDDLQRAMNGAVKLLWINYPHMPSGACAGESDFRRLVDFARRKGILICNDNAYCMVDNPGGRQSILAVEDAGDVAVELCSLSKGQHMAGWRIGCLAGGKEYLDCLLRVSTNFESGMFYGLQMAAVSALANSGQWRQEQDGEYRRRKQMVADMMSELGFHCSAGNAGLFLWARAPQGISSVEDFLNDILKATGVFITPGRLFGENGRRFARVSVSVPTEQLEEAARRLKEFSRHAGVRRPGKI